MPRRPSPPADPATLRQCLNPALFKALGDAQRLALLARLAETDGPASVTELSTCCGVHLSGVSRHLKILHEAGVLAADREGREVRYRLDCGALAARLRDLAAALERCQEACAAGDPGDVPTQETTS